MKGEINIVYYVIKCEGGGNDVLSPTYHHLSLSLSLSHSFSLVSLSLSGNRHRHWKEQERRKEEEGRIDSFNI